MKVQACGQSERGGDVDEAGQTGRVDTGAGVRVSFRMHASDGLVKPHVHFARWCRLHACSANAATSQADWNKHLSLVCMVPDLSMSCSRNCVSTHVRARSIACLIQGRRGTLFASKRLPPRKLKCHKAD